MEKLLNDFKIAFTKGDTYALAVKIKNITQDLGSAYFTVKENPEDEPLIQKSLGAGVSKIDDRAYKNEKTYKIQLQSEDTAELEPLVQYLYDFRVAIGNVVKTLLSGVFVVNHSISEVSTSSISTLEVSINDVVESEASTTAPTKGIEYEQDPVALSKIGDLTTLNTDNKETVVGALNEVKGQTDAEATARANADTAEATARAEAVNNEATARANADNELDERLSNIENGSSPVGKATSAEKLETTGKLAGINTTLEHNVKQQFPSNILSISNNPLGGLTTFNSKGDKLKEAGIYLVRGYEKLSTGAIVYISTMLLVWDGIHPCVSSVGFLPNQTLTTAKTIYLAVLDTNGTLGCYQCNDEVPLETNNRIDDYDLTFRLYKIGETTLFEIDN